MLVGGATTAWEVASMLTWSRPWSALGTIMRSAAVGEALAHLYTLADLGRAVQLVTEPPQRWLHRLA